MWDLIHLCVMDRKVICYHHLFLRSYGFSQDWQGMVCEIPSRGEQFNTLYLKRTL